VRLVRLERAACEAHSSKNFGALTLRWGRDSAPSLGSDARGRSSRRAGPCVSRKGCVVLGAVGVVVGEGARDACTPPRSEMTFAPRERRSDRRKCVMERESEREEDGPTSSFGLRGRKEVLHNETQSLGPVVLVIHAVRCIGNPPLRWEDAC
jgi:hypothetical protein